MVLSVTLVFEHVLDSDNVRYTWNFVFFFNRYYLVIIINYFLVTIFFPVKNNRNFRIVINTINLPWTHRYRSAVLPWRWADNSGSLWTLVCGYPVRSIPVFRILCPGTAQKNKEYVSVAENRDLLWLPYIMCCYKAPNTPRYKYTHTFAYTFADIKLRGIYLCILDIPIRDDLLVVWYSI